MVNVPPSERLKTAEAVVQSAELYLARAAEDLSGHERLAALRLQEEARALSVKIRNLHRFAGAVE